MWLLGSVAWASPTVAPPRTECPGGTVVTFDKAAARRRFAAAHTPEEVGAALASIGDVWETPPDPGGTLTLDVFPAALYGATPTDLVLQARAWSLLTGVVLHPLDGRRYCSRELPFLPGNSGAAATFAFLALTDPARQTVRVESHVTEPGAMLAQEDGIALWEIRGDRWVELFAATASSYTAGAGMLGGQVQELTVTPIGDTFPKPLRGRGVEHPLHRQHGPDRLADGRRGTRADGADLHHDPPNHRPLAPRRALRVSGQGQVSTGCTLVYHRTSSSSSDVDTRSTFPSPSRSPSSHGTHPLLLS